MKDRPEAGERLPPIYRRWVRAQSRLNPARFGARAELDLRLLLLIVPFTVAPYLGQPDNPFLSWVRVVPPTSVALGLVALWGWNGWLGDRWLARNGAAPQPAWRRLILVLACGLPWLGLLLLPAWLRWGRRLAKGVGGPSGDGKACLDLPAEDADTGSPIPRRWWLGVDRLLHAFERSLAWPIWATGVNFLALLALVAWLRPPHPDAWGAVASSALSWVLRGVAVLGVAGWALRRGNRLPPSRRIAAWLAVAACLLPEKCAALPLFALIAVGIDKQRERSLVFAAHQQDLARASSLPRWRALSRRLDAVRSRAPWWQRWRVPRGVAPARVESSEAAYRRRRLGSVRIGLAFFEFAGLGVALSRLSRSAPMLAGILLAGGAFALTLAALAGGAGLVAALVRSGTRDATPPFSSWSFGLLLAAGAAFSGLLAGWAGGGDLVQVTGGFLFAAGAVSFARNPFVERGGEWSPLLWTAFYFGLATLAFSMVRVKPLISALAPLLGSGVLMSPALGAAVGGLMVAGLEHRPTPGGGGHVRALALLTLASPLGGLAAPWWLHRASRSSCDPQEPS